MGSPAARLGDPTVHGGIITVGFPSVLIGGQPASRIGDMHACPMVTALVPHAGGPLIMGSFTVLTGGAPQSRVGDMLVCIGPPDAVAMGCPTVVVGMAGGGVGVGAILVGLAAGLRNFVGPPAVYPFFSLVGTSVQISQIQAALAELYSTRSGQALFASIAASGHIVTIQTTTGGSECASEGRPGISADSTVSWNPVQRLPGLPSDDSRSCAVVLGHELCHANHNANGTNANGPYDHFPGQAGSSARGEERQTVGSPPPYDGDGNAVTDAAGYPGGTDIRLPDGTYAPGPDYSSGPPTDQPTENSIRDDFGFPRRGTYYPPTWPGGPPW